jgi:hypothetical protein
MFGDIDLIKPSEGKAFTMDELIEKEFKPRDLILELDTYGAKDILQREYNRRHPREIFWKTKTGKKINIKDMTDEHLLNAINCIDRMEESDWEYMSWATDTDLF